MAHIYIPTARARATIIYLFLWFGYSQSSTPLQLSAAFALNVANIYGENVATRTMVVNIGRTRCSGITILLYTLCVKATRRKTRRRLFSVNIIFAYPIKFRVIIIWQTRVYAQRDARQQRVQKLNRLIIYSYMASQILQRLWITKLKKRKKQINTFCKGLSYTHSAWIIIRSCGKCANIAQAMEKKTMQLYV